MHLYFSGEKQHASWTIGTYLAPHLYAESVQVRHADATRWWGFLIYLGCSNRVAVRFDSFSHIQPHATHEYGLP